MMAKCIFQIFLLCLLAVVSGCVSDQDMVTLNNRVYSLEMDNARHLEKQKTYDQKLNKEFEEITGRVGTNDRQTREKYAEINALLDGFRDEIRVLAGRMETLEFLIGRDGGAPTATASNELKRLDEAISRNYQRVMALEAHLGMEPTDSASSAPVTDKPDASEAGMYTTAKTLLDNGDNKGARKEFEIFVKTFPDSTNADNARFWIADSYYRENWYEKAILEYQKVIETYSSGNKVPAALLKQGYAFANLGEKGNARLILKELIRKFPGTSESKIAKEKLEALK